MAPVGRRRRRPLDGVGDERSGLDGAEQAALASHVRAMTHIIRGSYDWARTETARGDLNGVALAVASGYEDIHL